MPNPDLCAWKRCRRPAVMTYLERPLREVHYDKWCTVQDDGTNKQRAYALSMMGLLYLPALTTSQYIPRNGDC